eukprot:scaffold9594_cov56-Phaeocystis_antarctica.AAC.4
MPAQLLDLLLGELLGGLLRLPRGLLRLALDLVRGRARARIGVRVRVRGSGSLGRVLDLLLSTRGRPRLGPPRLHLRIVVGRGLSKARLNRVSSRTRPVWMHWSAAACGSPVLAREACASSFGVRALCGGVPPSSA